MAFDRKKLFTFRWVSNDIPPWLVYKSSTDDLTTITGAGYFDSAAADLPVGTVIVIHATDSVALRRVSANTGSAVTLAAMG